MSHLQRRVGRLQHRQRAVHFPVLPFRLLVPGEWPPQAEAAYWAAKATGDQAAMDELVARQTGERAAPPGANQLVIVVGEVPSPVR